MLTTTQEGLIIDGDGIIDVKPEDADYQSTALSRARPLFAQLPGNVFPNPSQTLSGFSGNQRIGFYAVLNNSTEGILSRITLDSQNAPKSEVVFATPSANNGLNPVGNVSGNGSSQLGLSFDLSDENGENFNDLGLAIEVTEEESALNPSLDDGELGETLDLRNIDVNGDDIVDDNIVVQFTVNADGVYDNFVGLYEADDERGAVAGIAPGADGYAAEAIRRRVIGFQGSGSGSVTLSGNDRKILVPFMIADGTPESFLADNVNNDPTLGPIAYFEDRFANPDGVDHIIGIDSNTLGFEEFYNGGDHDFNDAVAMINYLT